MICWGGLILNKVVLFAAICLHCIINGLSCQTCMRYHSKDRATVSCCNLGNVVPVSGRDMHDSALRTTLPKILGVVLRQQQRNCNSNMASLGRRRGVPVSRERSVTSHPGSGMKLILYNTRGFACQHVPDFKRWYCFGFGVNALFGKSEYDLMPS